jgi:HAE1 family hydrophobic/amphiphilic exporter-1
MLLLNGVLLVEYVNELRRRGRALHGAVVTAGRTRRRPIPMTSLTTLAGLFPMALGIDVAREASAPLARAVIGGLAVFTGLTLLFTPALCVLLEERFLRRLEASKGLAASSGEIA